jgi:hypothetical protein
VSFSAICKAAIYFGVLLARLESRALSKQKPIEFLSKQLNHSSLLRKMGHGWLPCPLQLAGERRARRHPREILESPDEGRVSQAESRVVIIL